MLVIWGEGSGLVAKNGPNCIQRAQSQIKFHTRISGAQIPIASWHTRPAVLGGATHRSGCIQIRPRSQTTLCSEVSVRADTCACLLVCLHAQLPTLLPAGALAAADIINRLLASSLMPLGAAPPRARWEGWGGVGLGLGGVGVGMAWGGV